MKSLKFFFILGVLSAQLSFAQTSLQPYHWTWPYLDYLKTAGILPALNLTDRPWQEEEIALALKNSQLRPVSAEYGSMIRLLNSTFAHDQGLQIPFPDKTVGLRSGIFSVIKAGKTDLSSAYRIDYEIHPYIMATVGQHLTLYANYKIFNHPAADYIGKRFRNLTAYEEQGYLYFHSRYVGLKIGRDYLQTGPGRSGQLLLSDNSRPFDQYQVRLGSKNIYLKFYGIQLNRRRVPGSDSTYGGQIARRFINGHGLYFNIKDKYFFNVNELILYGGPNENWQFALMNPINLYYAATANGPFVAGNSFYDLNFDLYLPYRLNVYGDLLIDDFQVDKKEPGDLEPNEIGLLIGGNWNDPLHWPLSRINLEYVQIRNRTYNAPVFDWEKFLHRNEVIGYYLGNDLKAWYGSVEKWWSAKLRTRWFVQRILKGEGSVRGEFNKDYLNYTVEEGYDEPFPWGVVEKHWRLGAQGFMYLNRFAQIHGSVSYEWVENYGHITGKKKNGWDFEVKMWVGM